jgi:outer membrane lipoprotein carrier protein
MTAPPSAVRAVRAVLPLLACLAAASARPAAARTVADPVARLERALAGTRDLEAAFVQTRRSDLLREPERTTGRLYLRRPGSARLEYDAPEKLVLLKRGDSAWVYVPSLSQVQVMAASATGIPIGWVLGSSLSELRREAEVKASGREVVITPRPGGQWPWRALHIRFGARSDFPEAFVLRDAGGDEIEIRFTSVSRNRGVPASRFFPRWPEGTRVVELGL